MTERYVYGDDERLLPWAEERIPFGSFRDDAHAIGYEKDGRLVAVVVFDTFSTTGCFVHLASEGRKWMSRDFAAVAMAYPFIQCGFPRVTCIVSTNNAMSVRFTRLCGWVQEGVMRGAGNEGEDILIFGMLRRECRWLPPPALWPSRRVGDINGTSTAHDVRFSTEHRHGQISREIS